MDGPVTISSPASPRFANVPSSLTTRATTPGTRTPDAPGVAAFASFGVNDTDTKVSVRPDQMRSHSEDMSGEAILRGTYRSLDQWHIAEGWRPIVE